MDTNEIMDRIAYALPFRRRRRASWLAPVGIGIGIGVVVGFGCGVLLAPHSGEDTRRVLRNGASRAAESARKLAMRAKTRAGLAATDAADRALEASEIAQDYAAR